MRDDNEPQLDQSCGQLILAVAGEVGCCEEEAIRLIDARLFADQKLMSTVMRLTSQEQADVWSLLQRELASRRALHS